MNFCKQLRLRTGLNQQELANKLGIGQPKSSTSLKSKYFNEPYEYLLNQKVRLSKDEYYLKVAEVIAIRSTCLKHKYGCVIVNDDIIVAAGYNGSPRGEANCCDTGECYQTRQSLPVDKQAAKHGGQYGSCVAVHAEQNALISASGKELRGATLYLVYLSGKINSGPCNTCNRMIKNAGIARVVTEGDIICNRLT